MINIVKEIKINILNSVKFLMRVYKRGTMFALFFSFLLVYALVYFNHLEPSIFLHIASFSLAMLLTLTFLYILDLIKAIKKFFEDKAEERVYKKLTEKMIRVSIKGKN